VGAQLYAHNTFNKTKHRSAEDGTLKYEASFAFEDLYTSAGVVVQEDGKIISIVRNGRIH
jgi:hypothetical protein